MSQYYPIKINDQVIEFPSVTTQITQLNRKGLLGEQRWYFKPSKDAFYVGNTAHNAIAFINDGGTIGIKKWYSYTEEVRNSIRAYIRFKRQFGFIPQESEFVIYNLEQRYAGRVDCRGLHKNRAYLVDWTTGMKPVEYWKMQLALYLKGYIFIYPRRRIAGMIKVNLNKLTGNYSIEIMYPDEAEQVYQEYLTLKRMAGLT
jgi:hypothetical protein